MENLAIDICTEDHADALAALHARCFDEPWDAEAMGRILALPGTFGLICSSEGAVVAFILCRAAAEACEILSLGVAPEMRRSGLASRLLEAALLHPAAAAVEVVFLEVAVDNAVARRFYRSRGYAQAGRRKAYYRRADGKRADALVLKRALRR